MNDFETVSFMSFFMGIVILIITFIKNESIVYYLLGIGLVCFGIFMILFEWWLFRPDKAQQTFQKVDEK